MKENLAQFLSKREIYSKPLKCGSNRHLLKRYGVTIDFGALMKLTPDESVFITKTITAGVHQLLFYELKDQNGKKYSNPGFWEDILDDDIKLEFPSTSRHIPYYFIPKYSSLERKQYNLLFQCGVYYFARRLCIRIRLPATVINRRTYKPKDLQISNDFGIVFNDGTNLIAIGFHNKPPKKHRKTLIDTNIYSVVEHDSPGSAFCPFIAEEWKAEQMTLNSSKLSFIIKEGIFGAYMYISRICLKCDELISTTMNRKMNKLPNYKNSTFLGSIDYEVDMKNWILDTTDIFVKICIIAVCEICVPNENNKNILINEFHIFMMEFCWNLTTAEVALLGINFIKKIPQNVARSPTLWYPLKNFPYEEEKSLHVLQEVLA